MAKKLASGGSSSSPTDVEQAEDDAEAIAAMNQQNPGMKRGGKAKFRRGDKAKKEMRAMGGPAKSNLGKPARKASGGDCYADGGKAKHWIQDIHMKKGALHKELGVPQGEKIPEKKLDKAAHSSNPLLAKRANLAKTLKGLKH